MEGTRLIIALLLVCIIDGFTSAFVVRPSIIQQKHQPLIPPTRIWNELSDDEVEDVQSEINKLVESPPMFSVWSEDNFDEEALPMPLFTASLVSLASIAATAYIYYLAFSGPASPPTP